MQADKRHEVQALATEAFKAAQENENEHLAFAIGMLTREVKRAMRGVPYRPEAFYAAQETKAVECLKAVQYLATCDAVIEPAAQAVHEVKQAWLEREVAKEAAKAAAAELAEKFNPADTMKADLVTFGELAETEHALNEAYGV